jgi:hypothetical protein
VPTRIRVRALVIQEHNICGGFCRIGRVRSRTMSRYCKG